MDEQNLSSRQLPVGLLVAAHLVPGVVAASFSANEPAVSSVIFTSLVFNQANSLGRGKVWPSHWTLRLFGVVTGTVLLWLVLGFGIGVLTTATLLLVVVATSIIALVTWIVGLLKARLGQITNDAALSREGLPIRRQALVVTDLPGRMLRDRKQTVSGLPERV